MTDPGSLPSGVVTFLATDIDGAAKRWDDEPSAMREAVSMHRRQVADGVAAHGGTVVDEDPSGATLAVFAAASDALRAARAIQITSVENRWSTKDPLRVRAAVHTAEARPSEDRYDGPEVHRVTRLRAVAGPAEVLVSAATQAVVRTALPDGMSLADLGTLRARGLAHEEAAVLHAPGLATAVPSESDVLADAGVTRRERDVFHAVAERLTNAEIADRFVVSERTIESHVSSLLRKLGLSNRIELADLANSLTATRRRGTLPAAIELLASRARCVGRDRERAELLDAWHRTEDGSSVVVLVTGEAGIGKSHLVADVALAVHGRGARVLFGGATDGAGAPLEPFADALEPEIESAPEHLLREDLGSGVAELARVFPGIPARTGVVASGSRADDATAMRVAVASYLRRLSKRQPLLVVIEDLHWASQTTRDLIVDIARRAADVPLMLLVTSRDVAPDLDDALTSWLAHMARHATNRVHLGGLDRDATSLLLSDLASDADVEQTLGRTKGNPLFVREFAASGSSGETMHDFVERRLALLGQADREAVQLAAAFGETFDASPLAAALDVSVLDVLEQLDAAVHAGLVLQVPATSMRFAFSHALVRDATYDGLPLGRRLQVHARIAEVMDRDDIAASSFPELARHAAIAAPVGDPDRAVALCRMAGEHALIVGDLQSAHEHLARAIDIVDLTSMSETDRLLLDIRLGESLVFSDQPRSLAVLEGVIERARRMGDHEMMARAVCSMTSWGGSITPGHRHPIFVRLAEEALALLGDEVGEWRVRLQALLGAHLSLSTDAVRGRRLAWEAVELARALHDPETLIRSVLSLRYCARDVERQSMVPLLHEIERLAADAGLVALQEIATAAIAMSALQRFELDEADAWLERGASLTEANSATTYTMRSTLAFLRGDLDEAVRRNHEASVAIPEEVAYLYTGSVGTIIDSLRGVHETGIYEQLLDLDSFLGAVSRAVVAMTSATVGDVVRASALLAAEKDRGFATISDMPFQSGTLALWAEVAVALDDAGAAAALSEELAPMAGQLTTTGPSAWIPADRCLGMLASTLGEDDTAVDTLERSVSKCRRAAMPILLGRDLVSLAWARTRAGSAHGDVRELLAEAADIEAATGAGIISADRRRLGL